MTTLELHHWEPNGDSLKLLICLKEQNIEFTSRYVDVLKFEQYAPAHLRLAPMGQVPVLVHAGQAFAEPKLILEYLADAFPKARLAAADAAGWYDVQEWIRYADAQLGQAANLIGWHAVMLPAMERKARDEFQKKMADVPVKEHQAGWAAVVRDAESTEDRMENARGKIREAVARIESTLARSAWLAGPEYSIADINAFSLAHTLPQLMPADVTENKTPKLCAWLHKIGQRPAVKAALALRRHATDMFMPA